MTDKIMETVDLLPLMQFVTAHISNFKSTSTVAQHFSVTLSCSKFSWLTATLYIFLVYFFWKWLLHRKFLLKETKTKIVKIHPQSFHLPFFRSAD